MTSVDKATFLQTWRVYSARYNLMDVREDENLPVSRRQRQNYLRREWVENRPHLMALLEAHPELKRAMEVRFWGTGGQGKEVCRRNRHPGWFLDQARAVPSPGGYGFLLDYRPWCRLCGEISYEEVI